jgi:hypothetical protein
MNKQLAKSREVTMKKYSIKLTNALIGVVASLFVGQTVLAAEAETEWVKPSTYDDIRSGDQNRKAFRERVFNSLEKHFVKLANNLPKEYTVKISVLNVDLAGEIDFSGSRKVRVLRDPYFPRITLSYQLLNSNKKVVGSGKDKLKNMSFLQSSNLRYRSDSLAHEKKMLDEWFKKTFAHLT